MIEVVRHCNQIFGGFITGKLIDSAIIGVVCFIVLNLIQMPYAMLVSVIVGVTNVIPFFGPYIGAVPSLILISLTDLKQGAIFLIFIIVLQQIDGNILGPKILGNSTGLSPVLGRILDFGRRRRFWLSGNVARRACICCHLLSDQNFC